MEVATLRAGAEGWCVRKFKPDFSETPGGYLVLEMAASKNCTRKYITKFTKTQVPSTLPDLYHLYSPAD